MTSDPKKPDDYDERLRGWHFSLGFGDGTESVAPFVPSPLDVIREMLKLVKAGPDDVLYDLGCGDGRILLTAVKEFNVEQAVGFELNPQMVEATRLKILREELSDRIKIVPGSFFDADLSPATVVTLYLTTSGNAKLRPKFEKELKEGSRVVSHDFPVTEWRTVRPENQAFTFGSHKVYLYRVPDAYSAIKDEKKSRWDRFRRLLER